MDVAVAAGWGPVPSMPAGPLVGTPVGIGVAVDTAAGAAVSVGTAVLVAVATELLPMGPKGVAVATAVGASVAVGFDPIADAPGAPDDVPPGPDAAVAGGLAGAGATTSVSVPRSFLLRGCALVMPP